MLLSPYRFEPPAIVVPAVTLNPAKTDAGLTLSNGNLTVLDFPDMGHRRTFATLGYSSGLHYFEIRIDSSNAATNYMCFGIGLASAGAYANLGDAADTRALYQENGNKFYNSVSTPYSVTAGQGNIIGIALDSTAGKVYFAVNNVWGAGGDPAAGTIPAYTGVTGVQYPAASMFNGGSVPRDTLTFRFKAASFTYSPPVGFSPWE